MRAVEPLIAVLHDPALWVRENAAASLGRLGNARALEPLTTILRNDDAFVSRTAAKALGDLGDMGAVEPLIAALQDRNRAFRRVLAQPLGSEDASFLERLTSSVLGLVDAGFEHLVRSDAAEALARLGDLRAIEPLLRASRKGPLSFSPLVPTWIAYSALYRLVAQPNAWNVAREGKLRSGLAQLTKTGLRQ